MGILDENVQDLSLSELTRLIAREVSRQVPAIPAGISALDDQDTPVLHPDVQAEGQVLTYDAAKGYYVPRTPEAILTPPDAIGNQPTVKGGLGFLAVTWDENSSAVPVRYEVHVVDAATRAGNSAWAPTANTLSATIAGGITYIRTLPPDDTALTYFDDEARTTPSVYYVKIVPVGYDGTYFGGTRATAASLEGAGSMDQTGTTDIVVGSITAEMLESVLTISNTFQTGDPGTQRVIIDDAGVRVEASDGTNLVNLRSDPSQPSEFNDKISTSKLTITDSATIQGSGNILDQAAVITLKDALSDPSAAPTLAFEYDTDPVTGTAGLDGTQAGLDYTTHAGSAAGTTALVTMAKSTGIWGILEVNPTSGAFQRLVFPVINLSGDALDASQFEVIGIAQIVTGFYHIGYVDTASSAVKILTVDMDGFFARSDTITSTAPFFATGAPPGLAMGTDGTNILICGYKTSAQTQKRVAKYTLGGGLGIVPSFSTNTDLTNGIASTHYKTCGITGRDGTNWYISGRYGSGGAGTANLAYIEKYVVATATLSTGDGNTFVPDAVTSAGNSVSRCWAGLAYGNSILHAVRRNATTMVHFSDWVWPAGDESDVWNFGYQWYNSGSGFHTKISPRVSIKLNGANADIGQGASSEVAMRGQIRVIMPSIPSLATGPRVYELRKSTTPTVTNMLLQTADATASSSSTYTVYLTGFDSGAAYVDTNTFTSGTAASLVAGASTFAAPWRLQGDGVMRLPRATVAQRLSSPTVGDIAMNSDTNEPVIYNGRYWAPIADPSVGAGRSWEYYNDFINVSNLTDLVLIANNGGVAPAAQPGESGHPGILRMTTGTTSNATGNAGLRLGVSAATSNPQIQLGAGVVRFGCLVRISSVTTPFVHVRAGLMDTGPQTDPTVGFQFRWDGNVNSNKWQRAIGSTFADTGAAAVVGGTWYLLEIIVAADGASAEFFINGVSVGTSSGSAQTGSVLFAAVGIDKDTSSATNRNLDVDLIYVSGETTANRYG